MGIFPKWRVNSQPLCPPHSFNPLSDLSLQTKVSIIQYIFSRSHEFTNTTHPRAPSPPTDQSTTAVQQCSSIYGGIPVRAEHLIDSGVLRIRSTVRNAGRFVLYDAPSSCRSRASRHPPSTHHPPPTHRPTHRSSTTAVEQYVLINPQRQHSSTVVRNTAVHQELGGIFTFLRFSHLPGESASRCRERLFMPPARGVGTRRPLCRREHRRVDV